MSSIKQLNTRGYAVWPGVRVKTINGEIDTDHLGAERETPPGSVGWLDSINCVDNEGVISFSVHFDNGAAIVLTRAELDESAKYQLLSPITIRQLALYLRHGFKVAELTIYDDAMVCAVEALTSQYDEIIVVTEPNAHGGTVLPGVSVETMNGEIDVVVTKVGIVDVGIDSRDEYLVLRNREGDLSPDQAIAYLRPLVCREGRGPGSYFCTTVNAVQKQHSTDTVICTILHRYDV